MLIAWIAVRPTSGSRQIRMFSAFCRVHGYAATQGYADGGTLISGCPGSARSVC